MIVLSARTSLSEITLCVPSLKITQFVRAVEAAEESTTPFVVTGDELAVVGDANETQKNIHEFKMRFRVPSENGYTVKEKVFKDVYITPRQDAKVVKAFATVLPYLRKVDAAGDVEKLGASDVVGILESLEDEFFDAAYDVVASVLRVDAALKEYMLPMDVIDAMTQIAEQIPEVINESDTFFG